MQEYISLITHGGLGALAMYFMYRLSTRYIRNRNSEITRELQNVTSEIREMRKEIIELIKEVSKHER